MKNIKVVFPKIKVAEIKLTNDNETVLNVATWLYDKNDNYVGSINLSSKSTSDNTLVASDEIVDLITDLFIKVESSILEKDLITFTGIN